MYFSVHRDYKMANYPQNPQDIQDIPEVDPLSILTQELQKKAASFSLDAVSKVPVATQMTEALSTNDDYAKVAASTPLDEYYANVVGPSAKVVNVFAPGSRVLTGGKGTGGSKIKQELDPRTGNIIVFEDFAPADGSRQNDSKVLAASIESQGPASRDGSFNLQEAMAKAKTLSGEALYEHVAQTRVGIDMQMAKELERVRKIASAESGFLSAKAAYNTNLQMDQLPNPAFGGLSFAARFNQPSAQTQAARLEMDRVYGVSQSLTRELATTDSKLAELHSAREVMVQMEARRAQRELQNEARTEARTDRNEQRNEELTAAITPLMVANYRKITGSADDDNKVRRAIVNRGSKDHDFVKLVETTPSNIAQRLTDPNPEVVNGGYKLLFESEKATNPNFPADATTTPTIKFIKQQLANPTTLVQKYAPPETDKAGLLRRLKTPKTGKELIEARAELAPMLGAAMEGQARITFEGDTRAWAVTDSELQKSIAAISSTVRSGAAPIGAVVEDYITKKITTPDGKQFGLRERLAVLDSAIITGSTIIPKTMFVTPESIDAIRLQLRNQVKIEASRAFMRSQIYGEERLQGMEFLYSPEFKRPVQ